MATARTISIRMSREIILVACVASIALGGVAWAALPRNSVTTLQLKNNAVTSAKIAPRAVKRADIGPNAVTSAAIASRAVTRADLAIGAVGSTQLAAASVTAVHLAAGSVSAAAIVPGSVGAAQIADGSITAAKLAPGTIPSLSIADGSITLAKLGSDSVDSGKILDGSIARADLEDGIIDNVKVQAGSLLPNRMAYSGTDGQVLTTESGAVSWQDIQHGTARTIVVEADASSVDNGTALLAAIAAHVGTGSQTIIQLDPGTYSVGSSAIVLPNDVHLHGSGRHATAIVGATAGALISTSPDATSFFPNEISNLRLTLTNSSAGAESLVAVESPAGGSSVRLSRVEISVTADSRAAIGVQVRSNRSLDVHDSKVTASSTGDGVAMYVEGDVAVRGSQLSSFGAIANSAAIVVPGGTSPVIRVEESTLTGPAGGLAVDDRGPGGGASLTIIGGQVIGEIEGSANLLRQLVGTWITDDPTPSGGTLRCGNVILSDGVGGVMSDATCA